MGVGFLEWIISANHNKYDHVRAFKELPYIDWKQNANYSVGDKVFIYSTKPVSAIEFLVDVIETDITSDNVIDDKNYWVDMGEYEREENTQNIHVLNLLNILTQVK